MKIVGEFKEFITKGNAFDLAIGVIVGGAFGPVVTSMVKDIIMPIVSLGLGKVNFENLYVPLTPKGIAAAKAALDAGDSLPTVKFMADQGYSIMTYGVFINTLVSFFFLMLGVFVLIKAVNTLRKLEPAAAPTPEPVAATPEDIVLLKEIRDLLKK
ncbi:MAG: large conductance mechanosensitive channel protein MscL [Blastochloris sp.]|jgi:large conductance mechanosensitive channel|nr:large conductance mechanosensitive channel protein MscL [Blastochloris sp.]